MAYLILRLPEVMARTGLSRSTIYVRISKGLWPKPISLGERAVGWPDHEVEAVNAARVAGKSNEEVEVIVRNLEANRVNAAPDTSPGPRHHGQLKGSRERS